MAGVLPYGTACSGSSGLPRIAGTTPQLGSTFVATLTNALGNAPGALLMGLDDADVPLGGGCTQLVSTTAPYASLFVVTTSLGQASVATMIPNIPAFTGLLLHCQYGILDPAGALLGTAAFTSALTGLVGL